MTKLYTKYYNSICVIEARVSSVAGTAYGDTPVKGETAEVYIQFPMYICRYSVKHAPYCRFITECYST